MRTRGGGGGQNPENFADVLYVWSLTPSASLDTVFVFKCVNCLSAMCKMHPYVNVINPSSISYVTFFAQLTGTFVAPYCTPSCDIFILDKLLLFTPYFMPYDSKQLAPWLNVMGAWNDDFLRVFRSCNRFAQLLQWAFFEHCTDLWSICTWIINWSLLLRHPVSQNVPLQARKRPTDF